ncbi:MAG TPA: sigma-70 family RNA polymerase sigma factor [Pseudonocardiaceae bacterium]|nr:sigma-70 family RNA polymerase sigma factor [Pseudonocardiaceae bacterium]
MTAEREVEDLLRELAPQVLGILMRRHGALDLCEDAVQEALLAAATDWPGQGVPDSPKAWLVTVATRRLIDLVRSESSRRSREDRIALGAPPAESSRFPGADEPDPDRDDTLVLLLLCCHPALTPASRVALTLRAVGGLSTAEIAGAFFVPETTMAQRVSRAKQKLKGATFGLPPAEELDERLAAVRHVLYLIFTEGSTASSGTRISRTDLTREAIRLTRELHRLRPADGETQGLLALMLLTDARRPARVGDDGELIPLAEQDRGRWDRAAIDEGIELISAALASGPVGAYQLQAAIAAVHDEAADVEDTDWPQVIALYDLLDHVAPNPMATLNRALAVAMVHGPAAGLDLLATVADDDRVADHHRWHAMRGHLLEMAGSWDEAGAAFAEAARRTLSQPEQRYLRARADAARNAPETRRDYGGGT